MKTVEELTQKLEDLTGKVAAKRDELASAMLEKDDNTALISQLAKLESEFGATKIAIEKAAQKELERQEREREAKRAEADERCAQLDAEANDLNLQAFEGLLDVGAKLRRIWELSEEQARLITDYDLKKFQFTAGPSGWLGEVFKSLVITISNKFGFYTLYSPNDVLNVKFGKRFAELGNSPIGMVALPPMRQDKHSAEREALRQNLHAAQERKEKQRQEREETKKTVMSKLREKLGAK